MEFYFVLMCFIASEPFYHQLFISGAMLRSLMVIKVWLLLAKPTYINSHEKLKKETTASVQESKSKHTRLKMNSF